VSTVRFAKVIEACGTPDIHLLLIDPAKDKTLQAAIKADRVMTLYQQSGGTDHGIVGFEQGRSRQFLVFPKPLHPFLGQRIVGIKYELLEDAPVPKKEATKEDTAKRAAEPANLAASKGKTAEAPRPPGQRLPTVLQKAGSSKLKAAEPNKVETVGLETQKPVSQDKVLRFEISAAEKHPAVESGEIQEIKRQVREAMDALEQGKQIVAFNLLKQIMEKDK
jgi:hypothetical protein